MANNDRISELYLGEIWDPEQQRICRRRIHWLCSRAVGPRVLDVGCSQGICSLILGREGHEVVGIDLEEPSLEYARNLLEAEPERIRERVSFQACDAAAMPFDDDSFDSAIFGEVLEHVLAPGILIAEISRVVKPGGRILITTPLGLHLYPDHKQTFYTSDFLELMDPLLSVVEMDPRDKTIHCHAENTPSKLPSYQQAERFRDWVRAAEREIELAEERSGGKLNRLVSAQREVRDSTAKLRQENEQLQSSFAEERRVLEQNLSLHEQNAEGLTEALAAKAREVDAGNEHLLAAQNAQVELKVLAAQATERATTLSEALELRTQERKQDAEAVTTARAELTDVRASLAGATERVENLGDGLTLRIAELEATRAELSSARDHLTEARVELAGSRKHTTHLESGLERETRRLAEIDSELHKERELGAAAAYRANSLEGQLEDLGTHVHQIEQKLSDERRVAGTVGDRVSQLETELRVETSRLADAKEALSAQQREAGIAGDRASQLEAELRAETTRLADANEALSGQRREAGISGERISQLETELRVETTRLADANEALSAQRHGAAVAADRISQLEADLRAETTRLGEANEALAAQRRRSGHALSIVDDLQAELEDAVQALSRVRAELAAHRTALAQSGDEVGELGLELSEQGRQLAETTSELVRVSERASAEAQRADGLSRDLDHEREQAEALGVEVQRQSEELVSSDETRVQLEHDVSNKSDYIERLQTLFKTEQEARSSVYQSLKRHTALANERGSRLLATEQELQAIKSSISYRVVARVNRHLRAWGLRRMPMSPSVSKPKETAPKPGQSDSPGSQSAGVGLEHSKGSRVVAAPVASAAPKQIAGTRRLRVGAILDEFSAACFAPECDLLTFRPDNWQQTLEAQEIDFLLVESAWHGNDDAWQYRVASFQKNMGDELSELVDWCRKSDIPTVFWNKEDPSHYDRFIDSARLFDVIATTDLRCVSRYQQEVSHDRVSALPFAAQPAVHNPVRSRPRDGRVCFAGTWYGNRFQQRQEDMDALLSPALEFGLEIYDRMHGATGPGSEQYLFPEIYREAIRGRLQYSEMLEAYRRYQVFLNVNSVKDSPTMFSRRVFELLACGTPVISTPSDGIDALLGNDVVRIVSSEEDTRAALRDLLEDPENWARTSALGIRRVMGAHTYSHRFEALCRSVGLSQAKPEPETVHVISASSSQRELEHLADQLVAQTHPSIELWLCDGGLMSRVIRRVGARLQAAGITLSSVSRSELGARLSELEDDAIIASFSGRDTYGPEYLGDAVQALGYAGLDIVGKAAHYRLGSGGPELVLSELEHHLVSEVPSATLCARMRALSDAHVDTLLESDRFGLSTATIYAQHRFNYLSVPGKSGRSSDDPSVLARVFV